MGLKRTMPKCRHTINAMTGLQEVQKLQTHFARKHKIVLSMERALEFRIAMEEGHAPIRVDAEVQP